MTRIAHSGPTGIISSYDYSYDENGNRERQVETNAGRTETTDYGYDSANRLQTVTYEVGTAEATQVTYTYDEAGNRLTEQEVLLQTSTVTTNLVYTYDAINRLEEIDDLLGTDDVAYTYDPNGNTLTKTKNGVATEFLYDIRNQLGEVQQGASVLGRYGYDSEGLRILKIGDDGIRRYTYDQLSVITEANQLNATVSKYDYGMDQLVRLDNQSEGRSFFHLDGLRSTVGLTNDAGGSRQSTFYDAWGNERDRVGASANNFTFTGHELDEETGLVYAKARFYDSNTGRFLNQDDLLGDPGVPPSLHRYSYSMSNPVRFIDRDGRQVTTATAVISGATTAAPSAAQVDLVLAKIAADTAAAEAAAGGAGAASAGTTGAGGFFAATVSAPFVAAGGVVIAATGAILAHEREVNARLELLEQVAAASNDRVKKRMEEKRGIVILEDEDPAQRLREESRREKLHGQGMELGRVEGSHEKGQRESDPEKKNDRKRQEICRQSGNT
jgi:RHS repeat-associated protein